jgi:hypothetical protein
MYSVTYFFLTLQVSSLNKQVVNSDYENILSIFEYWKFLERSVKIQQPISISSNRAVEIVQKRGNISGNVSFQISPNEKLSVNYLYNAHL